MYLRMDINRKMTECKVMHHVPNYNILISLPDISSIIKW